MTRRLLALTLAPLALVACGEDDVHNRPEPPETVGASNDLGTWYTITDGGFSFRCLYVWADNPTTGDGGPTIWCYKEEK